MALGSGRRGLETVGSVADIGVYLQEPGAEPPLAIQAVRGIPPIRNEPLGVLPDAPVFDHAHMLQAAPPVTRWAGERRATAPPGLSPD